MKAEETNVTFEEAMGNIRKLVVEKKHENELKDVPTKLLFAIVEVCEAVQSWKKSGFLTVNKTTEEIIDAIFYLLDVYGILVRDAHAVMPSTMFRLKLMKNMERPTRYGRPDAK